MQSNFIKIVLILTISLSLHAKSAGYIQYKDVKCECKRLPITIIWGDQGYECVCKDENALPLRTQQDINRIVPKKDK
jgi:hypothetical protein